MIIPRSLESGGRRLEVGKAHVASVQFLPERDVIVGKIEYLSSGVSLPDGYVTAAIPRSRVILSGSPVFHSCRQCRTLGGSITPHCGSCGRYRWRWGWWWIVGRRGIVFSDVGKEQWAASWLLPSDQIDWVLNVVILGWLSLHVGEQGGE